MFTGNGQQRNRDTSVKHGKPTISVIHDWSLVWVVQNSLPPGGIDVSVAFKNIVAAALQTTGAVPRVPRISMVPEIWAIKTVDNRNFASSRSPMRQVVQNHVVKSRKMRVLKAKKSTYWSAYGPATAELRQALTLYSSPAAGLEVSKLLA